MEKNVQNTDALTGAAYIRVSTNDQMELSPESQLNEILKYAAANSIFIPEGFIFMEKEGRSGKKAGNRPEFQRMIATAKTLPRPFDVILVWKFSRFARNQDESTFYKGMLRKKLGIDILSVSEPILGGMYGRLIELIIEWQDEFYSCNLSAEVHRGMEQKAMGGGYQSAFPYGYRSDGPGKTPVIVKEQAEIVRTIFSLYLDEGKDFTAIAKKLNEKGCTTKRGHPFEGRTVSYILQNPFYTGKIRWNKAPHGSSRPNPADEIIVSDGRHKAIITEDLFEKAKLRIMHHKRGASARDICSCSHFLSGLLRCPICGAGLAYNRSQSPNFQCWKYVRGIHRSSVSVSEKKVLAALADSLNNMGLRDVCRLIQNPSGAYDEKGIVLRSIIKKIIYVKESGTFQFYYYL